MSSIVCHCFAISLEDIEGVLRKNPEISLPGLMEVTGAGTRCGGCKAPSPGQKRHFYLEDIWKKWQNSSEKLRLSILPTHQGGVEHRPFSQRSFYQKILLVEEIINASIRPILRKDGGECEVVDIGNREVLLAFHGACGTCPSSLGGTLEFIRQTLGKGLGVEDLKICVQSPSSAE